MSEAYDLYQTRLNTQGNTKRDREITKTKQAITNSFTSSPSYYQVQAYSPINPSTPIELDVWIIDDSKLKDQKQVSVIPDQGYGDGYLIHWKNKYWLTISADENLGDIYSRGVVTKCYSFIKWLDELGNIREAHFTYRLDFYRGSGVHDERVVNMPSERRYLYVQNNEHTAKIKKDRRFIFDSRVWKVTAFDKTMDNIIYFELEEDLASNANDDFSERIADYYNNLHTHSINILNGSNVNISTGDTLQLNIEIKDNGVITSLPVTYASSDETIATVDTNGIVTTVLDGSAAITVSLTSNPSISASIVLSMTTVVSDNFVINISGSSECKVGQSQNYISTIMNNGIEDNTKTVSWSLFGDDGVSATSLATIMSQTGTNCVLKSNSNNSYGYIRLVAMTMQDSNVHSEYRIKVRGLF